jgi:hypothetical protein
MGYVLTVFSDAAHLKKYAENKLLHIYRHFMHQLREKDRFVVIDDLLTLAAAVRPQVVVVLKGLLVSGNDVKALQQMGCWVVNINHDDFFSSNPNNWSTIQRKAIAAYDYIFPTREVNVAELEPYNPNVEFFPFAYYPEIHRIVPIPLEEGAQWNVDVVFVGTWEVHRAKLLEHLVQRVPGTYAIYGSQWNRVSKTSPLRRFIKMRELESVEMAKAIGGAKIALGFLRKENRDDYTQRTFEIPAIGGVLLAESTLRHEKWFKSGQEAAFFNPADPESLCKKVHELLTNDALRENIRRSGNAAVRSQQHTYRDRLARLFELHSAVGLRD